MKIVSNDYEDKLLEIGESPLFIKITVNFHNALMDTPFASPCGQDEATVENDELTSLTSDVYDLTSLQVDFVPNEVIL